jgi:hypothetical protein
MSQARNQHGTGRIFNGLHSVISQDRELFITAAVRISNPALT